MCAIDFYGVSLALETRILPSLKSLSELELLPKLSKAICLRFYSTYYIPSYHTSVVAADKIKTKRNLQKRL